MLSMWLLNNEALYALTQECHFVNDETTSTRSFWFCFSVATSFVLSLYVVVPKSIRQLDRSDPRQIRWRGFAVSFVCFISTLVYPKVFCASMEEENVDNPKRSALEMMGYYSSTSSSEEGIAMIQSILGSLLHVCLLYLGPFTASLLQAYVFHVRMLEQGTTATTTNKGFLSLIWTLKVRPLLITPFVNNDESERWNHVRNLILAPITEEIAFRACMVYPMLVSTSYTIPQMTWIIPLYFGVAHVHHAILKMYQGFSIFQIVFVTLFQFTYTTLFGAYATYLLLRSGNVWSCIVVHSFCNVMGLPDLSFFERTGRRFSRLYSYRWILLGIYCMGIGLFAWGFTTNIFLPLPPRLVVPSTG